MLEQQVEWMGETELRLRRLLLQNDDQVLGPQLIISCLIVIVELAPFH